MPNIPEGNYHVVFKNGKGPSGRYFNGSWNRWCVARWSPLFYEWSAAGTKKTYADKDIETIGPMIDPPDEIEVAIAICQQGMPHDPKEHWPRRKSER